MSPPFNPSSIRQAQCQQGGKTKTYNKSLTIYDQTKVVFKKTRKTSPILPLKQSKIQLRIFQNPFKIARPQNTPYIHTN